MSMTASNVYGTPKSTQPTNTAAPSPEPGSNIRTETRQTGIAGNPVSWLVGLIALAIVLIVSVRLEVEIDAVNDRLADMAISALVLVAVVILGLADVIAGEVVAAVIGAVLPSPVRAVTTTRRTRPQINPRSP